MFHGGAPPLRRRKTAADRRRQRLRAEGRGAQRLLRAFAAVRECRGGQLTPLAEALSRALGDGGRSASGHAAGEVPVPMTQGEIVHVQPVIQQERIQQHVEMVVELPVPMTQEGEIVHAPPITLWHLRFIFLEVGFSPLFFRGEKMRFWRWSSRAAPFKLDAKKSNAISGFKEAQRGDMIWRSPGS